MEQKVGLGNQCLVLDINSSEGHLEQLADVSLAGTGGSTYYDDDVIWSAEPTR